MVISILPEREMNTNVPTPCTATNAAYTAAKRPSPSVVFGVMNVSMA